MGSDFSHHPRSGSIAVKRDLFQSFSCAEGHSRHILIGGSPDVKSSALAQLMSRPTWNCHSHGGHSCLITIWGSLDAPGSVWTRWVLLPASPSMHVSIQSHLRVRTIHAPTEDNITYMHCIILLSLNTHSDLL